VCSSQSGSSLRTRRRRCWRSARHIAGVSRRAAEFLRVFPDRASPGLAPGLDLGRMRRQLGVRLQVGTFKSSAYESASRRRNPSSEASQDSSCPWKLKVHCCLHTNLPLDQSSGEFNPNPSTLSLTIHYNIFHPVYFGVFRVVSFAHVSQWRICVHFRVA
jgi:hypothetical protein